MILALKFLKTAMPSLALQMVHLIGENLAELKLG